MITFRRKRRIPKIATGPGKAGSRRRLKFLLLLLLGVSLLFNLFLFSRLQHSKQKITEQKKALVGAQEPADAQSEVAGKWYGLCQKNSISTVEDFRRIVQSDPLLAEHFADFDWSNARMGRLETSQWTHVAYRHNNRISTTRRAIRLPKGDGYITDGKRWVRSFCCNDYVLAASPDRAGERSDADGDRPRELAVNPTPDEEGKPPSSPVLVSDKGDTGGDRLREKADNPARPTDDDEIAAIPEPASILLLGTGIAGLGLAGIRRRKK